jgi:nicotinamidase-related amidase
MEAKWMQFMTERDRRHHAAGWGKARPFGLGQRPAVIVVDDYYGAVGIERRPILESVRDWPLSCGLEGWAAIDSTVELLEVARTTETPIVYLHGMVDFPSPWGNRAMHDGLQHLSPEVRARANDIVDEIAPRPGDLVIEKAAPSGFHGTPLLFHLNYLGIDSLIVCGETTSGCVRATVVDGTTFRYQVAVVEECCFDRTEMSHWVNLYDMDQKYADVMDLPSTTAYLRSRGKVAVVAPSPTPAATTAPTPASAATTPPAPALTTTP